MVSGILLGAGESKRMGVNKLLLPWKRKTVFEHCLDTLLGSTLKEVIVVLGGPSKVFKDALEKRTALADRGGKVAINPYYRRGMSSSIRRGIKVVDPRSQGILIALGDQPFLKTRTVNAIIHAFEQGKGQIIVPSFRGKKGHPVIFHRRFKKELLELRGDRGGRSILLKYPDSIKTFRVKSEGVLKDLDTWQAYKNGLRK